MINSDDYIAYKLIIAYIIAITIFCKYFKAIVLPILLATDDIRLFIRIFFENGLIKAYFFVYILHEIIFFFLVLIFFLHIFRNFFFYEFVLEYLVEGNVEIFYSSFQIIDNFFLSITFNFYKIYYFIYIFSEIIFFFINYYTFFYIFFLKNLVFLLLFIPLLAILSLIFLTKEKNIKASAIFFSIFNCILIFLVFLFFKIYFILNNIILNFNYNFWLNLINFNLVLVLDRFTVLFVFLIIFLFLITTLISINSIKYKLRFFLILLFFLEIFLILTFMSINLFFFYLFFEITLIPMFLLILIWGSRQRKINALYQFIFYTMLGSIFLLFALFLIYSNFKTFDLRLLSNFKISFERQIILWVLLFIGFGTKVPILPFHIWLPEAHVEAPTPASVILAGILLKVGTFGIFRFIISVLYKANNFFTPFVFLFCSLTILYISSIIFRQIDFKKIIAYSSIAHMNLVILGLFSSNLTGIIGSLILMIGHALVASSLFICVGTLYDRYKTRIIIYYKGLFQYMPLFSFFFLISILANLAFPMTSNFVGEFFILLNLVEDNFLIALLVCFSTIITATYSIWFYNRLVYFNIKKKSNLYEFSDLNEKEFFVLISLIFFIFFLGFYPNFFLSFLEFNSYLWKETNF